MTDDKSSPGGSAKDRRRHERSHKRDQGTLGFLDEFDGSPQRQDKPQSRNSRGKKEDEEIPMPEQKEWIKLIFSRDSAAGWTAVFTAVLMVFSGLLYMVSDKANEVNIATQRAIVNSMGPSWQRIPSPDGKSIIGWRFDYGWQNSGRTPAKNAVAQTNLYTGDKHPNKGLDFSTLPQNNSLAFVLGPNASFGMPSNDVPLSTLKEISDGKKHMFFWGWIVYEDGIPGTPKRLTEYCMDVNSLSFSKPEDPSNPASDLVANWPPCETHYCYDEQCSDYDARTKP